MYVFWVVALSILLATLLFLLLLPKYFDIVEDPYYALYSWYVVLNSKGGYI